MARKFVTNVDLNQNEIINAKIQLLASDPASPQDGQVWINTSSWTLKLRLNGVTIALGRLDQITAPNGSVDANNQRIINLGTPTAAADAVTKAYVDGLLAGATDYKESVRVATTTNITLSGTQTIDGVSVVAGDRVLVKNQTTASENGIYVVASGAWTRATDFDTSAEASPGALIPVEEGTANGDKLFIHATNGPVTLGTTSLTFVSLTAGGGSGTVNKYATSIGNGSATSFTLTHNLGTTDVQVQVYDNGNQAIVEPDLYVTNANQVIVQFATAPTNNQYRVVVVG